MCKSLKILGLLVVMGALSLLTATAEAGGGRFNGGGPRGGGGGFGRGPQPAVSIPDQFFGQSAAMQQGFFSQSVFPSTPNFVVTPMFQPGLAGYRGTSQVIVMPPQFSYVGSTSWGYSSSGLISIGGGLNYPPTGLVSIGGGLFPVPGGVTVTTTRITTISVAPSLTPIQMGLIGRW